MRTIVTVNTNLPSVKDMIEYTSGESLFDYDIVLFDPELPYQSRIEFTGGGSCIDIAGTERIKTAMTHWSKELNEAIKAGKIVFFLLNEYEVDSGSTGSSLSSKNQRTYHTCQLNNYDVLPAKISVRNAKGRNFKVVDSQFRGLYDVIKDITEYRVVFTSEVTRKVFTTKDETSIASAIMEFKDGGSMVFLPYFNLSTMVKYDKKSGEELWTDDAIRISKSIVGQLVEIERVLRSQSNETPKPEWIEFIGQPKKVSEINETIKKYEDQITSLTRHIESEIESKKKLLGYTALLYETGKPLELAIEKSLELLDYKVENFRENDLEIDHVITSPEGVRMIGESEGKDNSAIDISKFRQLESNINEDFAREIVTVPAKGLLFGNGYRLTEPSKRNGQFTQKCLTNAQRLGTGLIRTADLYNIVLYLLDNPNDKQFKKSCRAAIENTNNNIVQFPTPGMKTKKVAKKKQSS